MTDDQAGGRARFDARVPTRPGSTTTGPAARTTSSPGQPAFLARSVRYLAAEAGILHAGPADSLGLGQHAHGLLPELRHGPDNVGIRRGHHGLLVM